MNVTLLINFWVCICLLPYLNYYGGDQRLKYDVTSTHSVIMTNDEWQIQRLVWCSSRVVKCHWTVESRQNNTNILQQHTATSVGAVYVCEYFSASLWDIFQQMQVYEWPLPSQSWFKYLFFKSFSVIKSRIKLKHAYFLIVRKEKHNLEKEKSNANLGLWAKNLLRVAQRKSLQCGNVAAAAAAGLTYTISHRVGFHSLFLLSLLDVGEDVTFNLRSRSWRSLMWSRESESESLADHWGHRGMASSCSALSDQTTSLPSRWRAQSAPQLIIQLWEHSEFQISWAPPQVCFYNIIPTRIHRSFSGAQSPFEQSYLFIMIANKSAIMAERWLGVKWVYSVCQ